MRLLFFFETCLCSKRTCSSRQKQTSRRCGCSKRVHLYPIWLTLHRTEDVWNSKIVVKFKTKCCGLRLHIYKGHCHYLVEPLTGRTRGRVATVALAARGRLGHLLGGVDDCCNLLTDGEEECVELALRRGVRNDGGDGGEGGGEGGGVEDGKVWRAVRSTT